MNKVRVTHIAVNVWLVVAALLVVTLSQSVRGYSEHPTKDVTLRADGMARADIQRPRPTRMIEEAFRAPNLPLVSLGWPELPQQPGRLTRAQSIPARAAVECALSLWSLDIREESIYRLLWDDARP
jgi:hypothetical protein